MSVALAKSSAVDLEAAKEWARATIECFHPTTGKRGSPPVEVVLERIAVVVMQAHLAGQRLAEYRR